VWFRAGLVVRAGAAVLLLGEPARSDEPPVLSLDWHAPDGCPSGELLLARVDQLIGERGAPVTHPLASRELVTLLPDGRFRAEIDVDQAGAERTRVLEAETCTEIAEASAVVFALAISPATPAAPSAAFPTMPSLAAAPAQPNNVPPAPRVAAADEGDARAHERKRASKLGVSGGVGVALDFAIASTAAPGVALAVTLAYRSVHLGLRGSFFPEHASTVPGQPSQGVDISLLALAPVACAEPFSLPVELAACAEFEFGHLQATGFGPPVFYEKSSSWLAPGAGVSAAYPRRGPLRSRFGVDLLVPLAHTDFVLTNVGVAHTIPGVDPRLGLALEVAFP
jgi:hypothetical protein